MKQYLLPIIYESIKIKKYLLEEKELATSNTTNISTQHKLSLGDKGYNYDPQGHTYRYNYFNNYYNNFLSK